MAVATTVPAVIKNLAALLRLRANLAGVGVHTVDLDWTDSEAIVITTVSAPQAWVGLGHRNPVENATISGYIFTELAGDADSHADTAHTRAGVLQNELVGQLMDDPNLNGAVPTSRARLEPVVTRSDWSTWMAEVDGTSVARVRVDWTITYQART